MNTFRSRLQQARLMLLGSRRAKIIFAAAVILFVILISLLVWRYILIKQQSEGNASNGAVDASKVTGTEVAPASPVERAREQAMGGDTEKAQNTLLQYIKTNNSKEAQYQGYLELSVIASNAGRSQEAKDYALKAEEADPTPRSAWLVARAAQRLGQNAVARDYFQRAIDRYPPADQRTPIEQGDVENMQQSIKNLK